jgi:hypothetical protein
VAARTAAVVAEMTPAFAFLGSFAGANGSVDTGIFTRCPCSAAPSSCPDFRPAGPQDGDATPVNCRLWRVGLQKNENAIDRGAQTEHRGLAWPGRDLPGGETSPAAFVGQGTGKLLRNELRDYRVGLVD